MKVLLDVCVDHYVRKLLVGHDAYTARYMGWDYEKNGALLARAAANGFDVVLTVDKGMPGQHNPATLPLPVVVLNVNNNDAAEVAAGVAAALQLLAAPSLARAFHVVRP